MSVVKQAIKCPFCRETIAVGATRCKHCHSELPAPKKKPNEYFAKLNNFRFGFLVGLLFATILVLIACIHFELIPALL